MKIIEYYIENRLKYGSVGAFRKTLQHGIQKIIGTTTYEVQLAKQKEEIETLYYFLNNFVDIESVKPAEGGLRLLQECDVILLAILDKICEENEIPFFIGSGTLLGAERHGGFIPWDDDTDVFMLREHYERACLILPDICNSLGLDIVIDGARSLGSVGIGYKHLKTGIWVDIFPVDSYKWNETCSESSVLKKQIAEYRKNYLHLLKKKETIDNILYRKKQILPGLTGYELADISFLNTEFIGDIILFDKNDIFPLKRKQFETISLNVPNNIDGILRGIYGVDYMKFPRGGVEHHGNDKNRLSNWAKVSGVDMLSIKNELNIILNSLEETERWFVNECKKRFL